MLNLVERMKAITCMYFISHTLENGTVYGGQMTQKHTTITRKEATDMKT